MKRRRLVGFHPIREALRRGEPRPIEVLIEAGRKGRRQEEIERLCRERGIPYREVPRGSLEGPGDSRAQGFAASLRDTASEARPSASVGRDPDLLVLAEDLQDPRNLGALVRVCEAAGVGRLLLRQPGSSPVTETVARAAAGATSWLPVEAVRSWGPTLERLKAEGYWLYGLAVGGTAPWEIDLRGKVALVVGGEERGLRPLTRERCDGWIGLPMRGSVESLNLATAAAAVLYEALRQRLG